MSENRRSSLYNNSTSIFHSSSQFLNPMASFFVNKPNLGVVLASASLRRHPSSFYEVLGIPMTASGPDIKAAYRRLARTCHPDVNRNPKESEKSAHHFIQIQAAYSTLSDPDKRAHYDIQIYRPPLSILSPASGYSGHYTRRNWESDQCW
ncbi:chaperone protein dnaJ 11, chloroplastic-like [Momordica charantia]|uniref:Chaperone protein dnaJ 11, chloroplastic-like n=1 Tax=Momordica charantia TaxID=3673 RepID=A0A6J1CYZ9_MOMCH|nr:chaperone protein dnaJ 11, chloroplastic-like [Momordica charantia]